MTPFELWHTASLLYFLYMILVLLWTGVPTLAHGWRVVAGSVTGVAIVFLSLVRGQPAVLADWIWPPVVLLISYWTSGWTFRTPAAYQERVLASIDQWARVRELARRTPRPIAEALEIAYLGVYALVPITLLVHLAFSASPSPARFWAVVLITDFVCFGALPWVQTRPPRALDASPPWASSVRSVNLRLLESASVRMNTFPSGHAAEALACALLVLDAPAPVAGAVLVAALLVSAGAVLGQYHYLTDAVTGWIVAVVVWACIT
jgi:membrane-associated phospholipid phosphatase